MCAYFFHFIQGFSPYRRPDLVPVQSDHQNRPLVFYKKTLNQFRNRLLLLLLEPSKTSNLLLSRCLYISVIASSMFYIVVRENIRTTSNICIRYSIIVDG